MKTYKKPISRVIVLSTEDIMEEMITGSIRDSHNNQTIEAGGYTDGNIEEGHSKGFDSWE